MGSNDIDYNELNPRVSCQLGVTINLGNYESAKATVGLEVDVPPDVSVDAMMDILQEDLLDKLDGVIDNVVDHISKR